MAAAEEDEAEVDNFVLVLLVVLVEVLAAELPVKGDLDVNVTTLCFPRHCRCGTISQSVCTWQALSS
jgi:hypothetical protein